MVEIRAVRISGLDCPGQGKTNGDVDSRNLKTWGAILESKEGWTMSRTVEGNLRKILPTGTSNEERGELFLRVKKAGP
jgi:hypothetical protein